MLTIEGSSKMIIYNSKHNREHAVPAVVCTYNLHLGGVDLNDMRTYMFLDERTTVRWNKKVFFALLGKLLLNSFIIYQQNTEVSEKLERRNFIVKVVEGLISDFRAKQQQLGRKSKDAPNRMQQPEKHLKQTKLPSRKKRNCVVSSDLKKGIHHRTSYICPDCDVALCISECWEKYHTKKKFHWKCYCNYSV